MNDRAEQTNKMRDELKANGYNFENRRSWTAWLSPDGKTVAVKMSVIDATQLAYQHYLDAQKEAQSNQHIEPIDEMGDGGFVWNNQPESSASEPAIPQPLAELEALRQQVASHAEWASVVKRQWDELLAEKVKLESDLQATQATIVQFGIESEAMRTDFAEKHAKDSRINLNLSEENAKQSRMLDAVIAENTANRIALHEIANNNWNADRMRRTALEAYKAPMQQTASLEALESTEAVTLTEDELRWIAEQWNGKVVVRINPFSVPTKYQHLVRFHHQSDLFTDFTIAPEYDTEINRKAIEARRKQFVEKA